MYTMIPFRVRHDLARPALASMPDDRFFRSFFDMGDSLANVGFRVDVREEDKAYLLEAELPGVKQDQIELTVENDVLTITAQMNTEKKEAEKGKYLYSERRSGHFQRSFSLDGIAQDQIGAEYRDGILHVTLPKAEPAQQKTQRRIDIKG